MENNYKELIQNNPRLLVKARKSLKEIVSSLSYHDFINDLILKYDPEAVSKGWKVTDLQIAFFHLAEKYNRLIFKAPREHLKTATVLDYIIYRLCKRHFPLEILYFHISDQLAEEKFTKLKRIIENNPLLYENFKMDSASWSKGYIELADGSTIKPNSYSSATTGRHPHIIILDDVINTKVLYSDVINAKAIDKFYTEIEPMMSRDDPEKQIIVLGTVQRKDDLYHSLPSEYRSFEWGAYRQNGQPLSPEIYSLEDLMRIKKKMTEKRGEKYWLKEYMNIPFEAMGLIIKPEDILYYRELPKNLEIYTGWDLSVGKDLEKGDYTVGMTIGVDRSTEKVKIYIIDIFRARIDFNTRLEMVKQKKRDWSPLAIGVEKNAFQYDLVKKLQDEGINVVGIQSLKNKVESFQVDLAPYFENHQVFIREYMTDLKNELLSLPGGEYDDQCDALKFAINIAMNQTADLKFYTIRV